MDDGCEVCGKVLTPNNCISDAGRCICIACFRREAREAEYEKIYDEINPEENLDVYQAANIYFSNGCDEDYAFGYTPEELGQAFNQR